MIHAIAVLIGCSIALVMLTVVLGTARLLGVRL
jgi:hypothetical protein